MGSPATVTYGPIFIGVIFNVLLYGIMITQMFLYFTVYKRDKRWMKCFVAVLFVCDSLNTAFDIAFLYIPLVTKYGEEQTITVRGHMLTEYGHTGNESALSYATWIFSTDPAMTAIIALMVQVFFAWRVKVLTNNWPLVAFIAFCSFAQWCGGLGTSIACGIVPEFIHFQNFKVIVIIWLAFSATADTVITCALVWHLRKHRTGFTNTDDVVNKIIRLTVQTGMITAVCAIIDLIAFLSSPTGIHLVFNLPLAKLYTNSLMSSLNSRAGWKYGNSAGKALNGMNDSNAEGKPTTFSYTKLAHAFRLLSAFVERDSRTESLQEWAEREESIDVMPVQQVFIDVESHEMKDRPEEQISLKKSVPSNTTVNEYPSEKLLRSMPSESSVL
ncbi:hypothetical protein BC835DRAFT_1415596 [Cytidiella melzeri]|nr:hypothetical protein BC835DRAFT_1415596 [Cytidiella melzeri]